MGAHLKRVLADKGENHPSKYPPIPQNKGKRRRITNIWGKRIYFTIEDEITRFQSTAPHKVITFQKVRFEAGQRIEFRFGYYMIGVKKGDRGRWVWGQFCLLLPKDDLVFLLKEAEKRKWFQQ